MKKVKLNQEQIRKVLSIEDKFKKRDYIQQIGLEVFRDAKGQLLCTWATSIGKTIYAIKIIKSLRKGYSQPIHITVPTLTLKDQWEKQLKDIDNVEVFTIHSYCKLDNPKPLLLICDEAHIGVANESSEQFKKINSFNPSLRLYLTATVKVVQRNFIKKSTKIKTEFNISLLEGVNLKLVPEFKVYNVVIPFTDKEKEDYTYVLEKEQKCKDFFAFHGYHKKINPKQFPKFYDGNKDITHKARLMNINWFRYTNKRIALVSNAENKLDVLAQAMPNITKKTIFFAKTKASATAIRKLRKDKMAYYVSGIKDAPEQLSSFLNNEKTLISSVNKLISGFDDECTDMVFRYSFFSTQLSAIQQVGRCLRVDPNDKDKAPIMINFVIEPYDDIIPCDNHWLMIGLRGIKSENISVEEFLKLKL